MPTFPFDMKRWQNVIVWVKGLYIDGEPVAAVTVGDDLTVTGDASIGENLDVSGTLDVTGLSTLASLSVTGDAAVGDDLTVTGDAAVAGITASGDAVVTGHLQSNGNAAVTATVGGGTTGLIPAKSSFVTVTSDNADKQISLPAATIGDRIRILVGATACELISAVAAHKVNDVVVGATNEAALTATSLYDCQYVAANTWVVIGYTKLGAVQAALVPDAL